MTSVAHLSRSARHAVRGGIYLVGVLGLFACRIDTAPIGTPDPGVTPPPTTSPTVTGLVLQAGPLGGAGNIDGASAEARFQDAEGLVRAADGTMYVADTGNNAIRRIEPNGAVSTLAGLQGGLPGAMDGLGRSAGFQSPSGVAVSATGTVYVVDRGNQLIRKITAAGDVSTLAGGGAAGSVGQWVDGLGRAARFYNPNAVVMDGSGNLLVSDSGNHVIRKVTPDGLVTTIAGVPGQPGNNDGSAIAAKFRDPLGLAIGSDGAIYVADSGNGLVRRIGTDGLVTTLLTSGSFGVAGVTLRQPFEQPTAVAVSTAGGVFVSDNRRHVYLARAAAGVEKLFSADTAADPAVFAQRPYGLAQGAAGAVYLTDGATLRLWSTDGKLALLALLAGAEPKRGSTNGTATAARFNYPAGLVSNALGTVYVADTENHTIRSVEPGGMVTTFAGQTGIPSSADGVTSTAGFSMPRGVAQDSTGNLYIADTQNSTIRKVFGSGAVTTLAGKAQTPGAVDGAATQSRFRLPRGIAVDRTGNVYVADTANYTVRKITSDGVVSTLAGQADSLGEADGSGAGARFRWPLAVTVDTAGNVYVVDQHAVRKITPAGVVTTLAGKVAEAGMVNAKAGEARFNHPDGIAVDDAGNVYVADTYNHVIRRIDSAGTVSTLAGVAGQRGVRVGNAPGSLNFPAGLAWSRVNGVPRLTVSNLQEHNLVVINLKMP